MSLEQDLGTEGDGDNKPGSFKKEWSDKVVSLISNTPFTKWTLCQPVLLSTCTKRMMMNFMYMYTKTIKEANAHKLGRPPGESRRRNYKTVARIDDACAHMLGPARYALNVEPRAG
jgi:hypothetical protein